MLGTFDVKLDIQENYGGNILCCEGKSGSLLGYRKASEIDIIKMEKQG